MHYIVKMISVVALIGFLMAMPVWHGYAKEANQTTCPVLGSPVNKKVYVDYKGKRIYFCCPPCISKFNKEPEKYMKKFEEQGVVLEDAPGPQK
jgi:YHS domain-containing protein